MSRRADAKMPAMSTIVAKFGGTSVATPERVKSVARRVVASKREGNRVVAVVSAMGSATDDLIELARAVSDDPNPREMDTLLSTGEMVSMSLLAMAIESLGEEAVSMSGRQVGLVTDSAHGKASIQEVHATRIERELDAGKIVVVAGFQGIDSAGDITTLGRGGSDTTAVAIAAGIGAEVCEIYTDVDGVFTADPRIVPRARKLDAITYEEMLEMSAAGAGVLHKRCVEFARNFNVPIHCRSAFTDEPGTIVKEFDDTMEKAIVSGIAHDSSETKFTIRSVPDTTGVAAKVFGAMADANLAVDMIIQNLSENGSTDISFTTPTADAAAAIEVMQGIVKELGARELVVDDNIAKVSIVGAGMKVNAGVAAKMFCTLADGGINISMISTSDIRTSVVIPAVHAEEAVQLLHTAFGLDGDQVFEETQLSAAERAKKAAKGR